MQAIHQGRLCVIGAALCWSVVGAGVKFVSPPLNGWQVAAGRSLFAFLFLCAVLRPWRGRLLPSPKGALLALVYAAMLILFILANTRTLAANAILLQDSALLWIVLLSPVLLGEPRRKADLAVLLLCALGMTLLFKDQLQPGQQSGNLLALASGVAYALVLMGLRWGRCRESARLPSEPAGPLFSRRPPTDAELMILWGNLLCVLFCIPWMGPWPAEKAAAPLLAVAFMGVVQLGLGYYLASLGLSHVPATEGALLTLIEPVLNPVWAFLLVGEVPGPWSLCGGAVILVSIGWRACTTDVAAAAAPNDPSAITVPLQPPSDRAQLPP
ncbi:MAG: DMT family transporter [Planctomycetota bacterium]